MNKIFDQLINVKNMYVLSLFLYIIFLPISISLRQMGIVLLIITFLYDIFIKKQKIVFFQRSENKVLTILIVYFFLNTLFISIHKSESFEVLFNGFWQCFIIYFIVYIAIENERIDKQYLLLLIMLTVFIQGIDGVYQYLTGHDFIKGFKPWGKRLTAAMETPRVGNFVSLTLPAFFVFYYKNREKFDSLFKKIVYFLWMVPPLFLLIFSGTRSGWIGFLAFLVIFSLYNFKRLFLPIFLSCLIISVISWDVIYHRLNLNTVLNDPRFKLWDVGLNLFKIKPVFGHGISAFNEAYNFYKIYPYNIIPQYVHPHNIYVQLLCETGVIGFLLFVFFIGIRLVELTKKFLKNKDIITWLYFAWINSYLFTAISAHDFFRTWWLGSFMLVFAITTCDDKKS